MPPLEERALNPAAVKRVEDVGDVAAVDVVFAGVDYEGADEAAAGGAFGGVAWGARR
jgi:hypothetical protein